MGCTIKLKDTLLDEGQCLNVTTHFGGEFERKSEEETEEETEAEYDCETVIDGVGVLVGMIEQYS